MVAYTAAPCAFACSGSGGGIVGQLTAGLSTDYPVPSLQPVAGQPVAVGRDQNGFYAVSLLCTHEGCDIGTQGKVTPTLLTCYCHGAEFDGNGSVVRGPARQDLPHYDVIIDPMTGEVIVDGDTEVTPETRTPA